MKRMHSTVYTAMVRHGLVLHVRQQTPGRARCQPAKLKFSVGSFNEEHGEITVHHKDPSETPASARALSHAAFQA